MSTTYDTGSALYWLEDQRALLLRVREMCEVVGMPTDETTLALEELATMLAAWDDTHTPTLEHLGAWRPEMP